MSSEPDGGSPNGRRRRSSFTDMFARPSVDIAAANAANGSGPRTGSLSSALQSRARRMSITSIGLSGSPTHGQTSASAFDSLRGTQGFGQGQRPNGSEASENAVEDTDEVPPLNGEGGGPISPSLQRRLSFGAGAYKDTRGSNGSPNGEPFPGSDGTTGSPGSKQSSSPPSARKDGFNWTENLRNRAQRSSISAASGNAAPAGFMPLSGIHPRSKSIADQGGAAAAPAAAPKPEPPPPKRPDHFQERILKGDFYMD